MGFPMHRTCGVKKSKADSVDDNLQSAVICYVEDFLGIHRHDYDAEGLHDLGANFATLTQVLHQE